MKDYLKDRKNSLGKYRWLLRRRLGEKRSPNTNDYYYNLEVNEKAVYIQGLGGNVRGNMHYILDELNHNPDYQEYEIFVKSTKKELNKVNAFIKENGWDRTTAIYKKGDYYRAIESCKYLIAESFIRSQWIIRPEQVFINTWHGNPAIKHIGMLKNGNTSHLTGPQQRNFINAEFLLAPNEITYRIMEESYRLSPLLTAKLLMLGYPRTGGMLAISKERKAEILSKMAPNGEKVYLYMPTFRGHEDGKATAAKMQSFLEYFDQNLDDNQLMYVNLHHALRGTIDYGKFTKVREFPSDIDSYEIMAASDALISDYSSVFCDYLALRKHIILFTYDLEDYIKYPGLNTDPRSLPFDICYTDEQVVETLNRGKTYDDEEIWNDWCSLDTPDSAKILCSVLFGNNNTELGKSKLLDFEKSEHKTKYIYTHSAEPGLATQKLCEYINNNNELLQSNDGKAVELYIGCNSDELEKVENQADSYPTFKTVPVIGAPDATLLSREGEIALKKYLDGKLSFEKTIEILKYDYALVPLKLFGRAQFDEIVIYDTVEPAIIAGLALSDAKKKRLFIQNNLKKEIDKGNNFLIDVVDFAKNYCEIEESF